MNFKTNSLIIAVVLLLPFMASSFAKDSTVTLRGLIEDSQCAYNVHANGHTHDLMMKSGLAGGSSEKDCTLHCVKKLAGTYVLLVKNDVYKLDDQAQPEAFAGEKVRVTGTLDNINQVIHVIKIEREK